METFVEIWTLLKAWLYVTQLRFGKQNDRIMVQINVQQ